MDNGLAALVQAGVGTGAPTNSNSRYYGTGVEQITIGDAPPVSYLSRRIIPQMDIYTQTQNYTVVAGDRLDNLAARYLGDPSLFWMIVEANGVLDAESLTVDPGAPGRTILIPLASGIPPKARYG